MKNLFKQIIADFHENWQKEAKKRDLEIPLNTGKTIAII